MIDNHEFRRINDPDNWVSRHVPADKSESPAAVDEENETLPLVSSLICRVRSPYLVRLVHHQSNPLHPICCESSLSATMAIELTPLPLPASADPSYFVDFGREVKGVNPGELTPAQFAEIYDALYTVSSPIILL
jgi:hypothetical protein